jgi:hypothetical protein
MLSVSAKAFSRSLSPFSVMSILAVLFRSIGLFLALPLAASFVLLLAAPFPTRLTLCLVAPFTARPTLSLLVFLAMVSAPSYPRHQTWS